jgi:antitoxin PrlF
MVKRKKKSVSGCSQGGETLSCCKVESILSIDERGQMVLPKEVREKAGIHAGDKLALFSWEKEEKICCLSMIKVEDLTGMVKNVLGPLMSEITK